MRISDWSSDVCSSDLQGGCGVITLASPRHRKPMTHLIERLPRVRGEYRADAPVAQLTWFRVGGPAEILFRPANEADLIEFLAGCPRSEEHTSELQSLMRISYAVFCLKKHTLIDHSNKSQDHNSA